MRDLIALLAEIARNPCSPLVRLWLESRYESWWKLHARSNDAALARHLAAAAAAPGAQPEKVGTAPGLREPSRSLDEGTGGLHGTSEIKTQAGVSTQES